MNANLEYNLKKEQKNRMENFERFEPCNESSEMNYRNENRKIDNCEFSGFSMLAAAGSMLFAIGIVVYGIISAVI